MSLPKDPVMLLSYINTQLRDNYSSLEELCKSMDEDGNAIIAKLEGINYTYNRDLNKFV